MQIVLKMTVLVTYFEKVGFEQRYNEEEEVAVDKQQELKVIGGFAEVQGR